MNEADKLIQDYPHVANLSMYCTSEKILYIEIREGKHHVTLKDVNAFLRDTKKFIDKPYKRDIIKHFLQVYKAIQPHQRYVWLFNFDTGNYSSTMYNIAEALASE